MPALIALLLILAIFGGGGFALTALWYVLIAALVLWAVGFLVGPRRPAARRWYW